MFSCSLNSVSHKNGFFRVLLCQCKTQDYSDRDNPFSLMNLFFVFVLFCHFSKMRSPWQRSFFPASKEGNAVNK